MKKTEKRVWYNHKWTVVVFVVLRVLVVLTGVLSALRQDYESVFMQIIHSQIFHPASYGSFIQGTPL